MATQTKIFIEILIHRIAAGAGKKRRKRVRDEKWESERDEKAEESRGMKRKEGRQHHRDLRNFWRTAATP